MPSSKYYESDVLQGNPQAILASLGRNMMTGQGGSPGEDW